MTKIKIYYDEKGGTLSVWFADPQQEHISEEVGDGTIINKDKHGRVIGFEKLYVKLPKHKGKPSLPLEFSGLSR